MFKATSRMNRGLLLVLVGVLFVVGSTSAVRITLGDIENAIKHAFDKYVQFLEDPDKRKDFEWESELEAGGTMTADCKIDEDSRLINCGVGNLYLLNKSDLDDLDDWFDSVSRTLGNNGKILPPQRKQHGVYKANVFYENRDLSFNFHVPIDMNNKLRTFLKVLQKMLVARALMQ